MQDQRVKTFLTVCRTLNLTRAAEELHMTQPAVSQHIAYLEREYGAKLFSYRNRKLSLTEAGKMVRTALAAMVHDEDILRERVAALDGGARPCLRLGMTLTAGAYIAAAPLAAYLREHPEVRIEAHSGDTGQLLRMLDEGELDLAFVEGLFSKEPYAWDVVSRQRLLCVCSPDDPLAGRRHGMEELLGCQLFVREPGSGTRAVLEHALAGEGLSLAAFAEMAEVGSLEVIKVLVAAGLGISFLYEAAVRDELASGLLARVPFKSQPIEHDISLIRLKESRYEAEYKAIFKEVRAYMA